MASGLLATPGLKLLNEPFALHDVRDVEGLCRSVVDRRMRSWGARLRSDDYDDLLAYIVATAWELSKVYRPGEGLTFSTYCSRILERRVVDWYRQRFGDSRYGDPVESVSLESLAAAQGKSVADVLDERQTYEEDDVLTEITRGRRRGADLRESPSREAMRGTG